MSEWMDIWRVVGWSKFSQADVSCGCPTVPSDQEDEAAKIRKLVGSNNFTQQTNALDVDKHM
jgi:hypothetical protein